MNAFKMKLLLSLLACLCFTTSFAEFTVIDANKACNGQGNGIKTLFAEPGFSFESCKTLCRENADCHGMDYFRDSTWCSLFDGACTTPTATWDGASSWKYSGRFAATEFTLHDANKACNGHENGINTLFAKPGFSFESCKALCRATADCHAMDYFHDSTWCSLFDKACQTPTAWWDGASSWKYSAETCGQPLPFYTSLFLSNQQQDGVVSGCCNNDLNFHAGGDFIHLHARKSRTFPTDDLPAISDIFLSHTDCGRHAIKVEGCCDNGDLNNNAGGKFLYLCYKPASGEGEYVSDLKLVEGENQFCGLGYERVVHPGRSESSHNGDLNEGTFKSPFVYLCMKKEKCNPPVKEVLGVKTIGYWVHRAETRRDFEEEKTIKMTFSGSSTEKDSTKQIRSFEQAIKQKHSAEVAFEIGGKIAKIVKASVKAKYAYENERTQKGSFKTEAGHLAEKTYSQKTEVSSKVTVPARKKHESPFYNVWIWKTEAIREDLTHASHFLEDFALVTSGCGYDVPPNCLPGSCADKNCWTCTRKDMEINPDFVKPECVVGEDCEWVAIPTEDCPSRLEVNELDECSLDMEDGDLCEADIPLPDQINDEAAQHKFDVNNCPGNKDVFRYTCPNIRKRKECDFQKTFAATGCPNENISQGTLDFWDRKKFDDVLEDMLKYCNDVKDGVATEAQKQECCAEGKDCQASLKCVKQSTFTLCE